MKKVLLPILVGILIIGVAFLHSGSRQDKKIVSSNTALKKEAIVALPRVLNIPSISVQARFESVGMDSQGRMDVPKNPANVAWYNLGPKPGEKGSAVVAGHLDDVTGAPAAFWNLGKLSPGDQIKITDAKNKTYSFKVFKIATYPYQRFPLQKVFADSSGKYLNLITCSGTWDKNKRSYTTRTVVYSKLE